MTPPCPSDPQITAAILAAVTARAPRTICPSEVARALASDWRPLMPEIRRLADTMPQIVATQKGVPVSAVAARGPIRLGLRGEPADGRQATPTH